jgi:mannosyltransferase
MLVLPSRLFKSAYPFFTSPRVWMIAILLLAWGLRLFHLGAMSVWWDESLSYDRAQHDLAGILSNTIQIQNVTTRDLHPPLYFVLLHFFVVAFGIGEFALRTLSTFANVLTVALMLPMVQLIAQVARIRDAPRIAVLAALFAALSPFYVWYSQEARPYALVLFWSLLAAYALVKMMHGSMGVRKYRSTRIHTLTRILPYAHTFLYLFALGATLLTHYLSFILLPLHAAVIGLLPIPQTPIPRPHPETPRDLGGGTCGGDRGEGHLQIGWRRRQWRVLALLLLGAFGLALLLLPRSAAELTGSDAGGASFVPLFIMLRDVLNSFAVGVTANLDRVALLDLALIGLWSLGVASTIHPRRREYRLAIFSLAYLFLPVLALQLGSFLRPLYLNSRHLITASPAFYMGLALGVNALAQRAGHPHPMPRVVLGGIAAGALALVVGGAVYSLSNLYFDPAYAKDDHRAWSEFLRERARPGDLLILDAPQAEKIYEYYAPAGLKWISLPNIGYPRAEQERLDFSAIVDAYRNHARLWFLEIHRPVADPNNHIFNLLARFGTFVSTTYFPGTSTQIVLHEIDRDPPVLTKTPTIQHPLAVSFGDNLTLLGYDAPAQLAAGARGVVKLYWRLQKPSGEDYGVSLRAVDDAGARWGQWDTAPVGNLWPVSKWPAGAIVLDAHDLPIDPGTPPANYHLEVGVYRAANHEPLPASGSIDGAVRLSDVIVTRPLPPLNPGDLAMDHHIGVTFGNELNFIGYDVGDTTVRPGEAIPLTLYFQLLRTPQHEVQGRVLLTPPFFAFWNSTRVFAPFTLPLAGRLPGDMVQTSVLLRVPGDASGGTLTLSLALDGEAAPGFLLPREAVEIGDAHVESITRAISPMGIAHPMNVRLGEAVEFLGYDLRAPQPLRAGDSVSLTLFWRARKTMDTSYTVFIHLLDARSQIRGQNDSLPMNGTRETTSWSPGEEIADAHSFVVNADAAPGTYAIEIGMYNAADGTRLPVFDSTSRAAGDRVLLGELTVQ